MAPPLADAPAHLAREIGDLRKVESDLALKLSGAAAHRRIRTASDPVDVEPEVIDHFAFGPGVPSNEVEPDLLRRTRGRREGQQ